MSEFVSPNQGNKLGSLLCSIWYPQNCLHIIITRFIKRNYVTMWLIYSDETGFRT